jgi:INO80 complex subunit C
MAPSTPQPADDSHQQLLDQMDITSKREKIRKPGWKPSQRRNKNTKQIISESQRKEASVLASQDNSGATTPFPPTAANTDGAMTPILSNATARQPNIAQAAQSLSTLVLEKNLQRSAMPPGPAVTYTNIESAPSLHPAHTKHYCDITGLPSKYTDPKTRLRYHDKEVFAVVRTLPQGSIDDYLAARGAHVVLK